MSTIKATVRGGRLELERPINLPDGTELLIPLPEPGDVEEGWDNRPEGIADWIRRVDALEPLILTPQEEAEAGDWLSRSERYEAQKLSKEVEGLFP